MPTRRAFLATATAFTLTPHLRAQSRVDVAAIEHDRILAEAALALQQPIVSLTTLHSPQQDANPNDFYSEPGTTPHDFRAHAEALVDTSNTIATLTAAFVLTQDPRYALRAGNHLYTWFADPETRMSPHLQHAYGNLPLATANAAGLNDAVALAEIARSLPFLADTAALAPPDLAATRAWFTTFLTWLNTDRTALIARDTRDHTASAWLLLASATARLLADDATLTACRHRFKAPTLRNQVQPTGIFHKEVITQFPYRNSLFNFDMLAATCELLSTPFASLWPVELEDGPGLRGVAAFLYPVIKDPARWPYPADATLFREVPRRRPALLLAGRAYQRPEYVDLWRSLPNPPHTLDPTLRATLPIHQPLLWVTRPPHNT